tara:strand:- start:92 stop:397 length:306 start_codon:yes stop_codon:yes gene_type:complete
MRITKRQLRRIIRETYYGSIPGEPELPASYGSALDLAKVMKSLGGRVKEAYSRGELQVGTSVGELRALVSIPWDKFGFDSLEDDDLEWIIQQTEKKLKRGF